MTVLLLGKRTYPQSLFFPQGFSQSFLGCPITSCVNFQSHRSMTACRKEYDWERRRNSFTSSSHWMLFMTHPGRSCWSAMAQSTAENPPTSAYHPMASTTARHAMKWQPSLAPCSTAAERAAGPPADRCRLPKLAFLHVSICVCLHVRMSVSMYLSLCVYVYICTTVRLYICMIECMHECMHVCTHVSVCIRN